MSDIKNVLPVASNLSLSPVSYTSTAGTNVGKSVGAGKLITFDAISLPAKPDSAQLIIRASDVDYGLKNSSNVAYSVGNKSSEWDGVYIQLSGSATWSFVGYLNGTNNNTSYTTFDISALVASVGAGSYVVRVVPNDDGTQSQKSNGGSWTVTVPSAEIFVGGGQSISALSEKGQSVSSTWSADLVGSYTIQYLLLDSSGRAVAQVNAAVSEPVAGASQSNAAQLLPNTNFYSSWSELPSGAYTLQATLIDSSGVVRGVKSSVTTLDLTAPTVQITTNDAALKAGDTATLSFAFSEAPVGFALEDIVASHGVVRNLRATANPLVFEATLTPEKGFAGVATVSIAKGTYADAAENSGTAATLANLQVSANVLSNLDFEISRIWGAGEVITPGGGLWQNDNGRNMVEVGREAVYGSTVKTTNHVVELAAGVGDASNLYTDIYAASGTQLQLSFDYSGRAGAPAAVEVVWGGKVIDTIRTGGTFGYQHADYTVDVSTTGLQELELRAIEKGSFGTVLDNIKLSATQVTGASQAAPVAMGTLDFQGEKTGATPTRLTELLDNKGWFTDNAKGFADIGAETSYGGKTATNQVIELAASKGDASNLYTHVLMEEGARIQFSFDLSARTGQASKVNVLWGGKVIDTINAGVDFAWKNHSYDLVATGDMQRLEVQAVDRNGFGAVLDNLTLTAHPVI